MAIPVIDDRIRHVGVSALRGLNAKTLRELKDVLVLQVEDKPVAVLIPYNIYMEIQQALWPCSLLPALEEVFGPAVLAQAEDARANDLTSREEHNSLARTESGHLYRRGQRHECGVADCPANTATSSESPNPSPYATVLYTEEDRQALGCTCTTNTADPKCPLENHRGRVVLSPVPLREGSVVERIKEEGFGRDIKLTAIGTDMTPRGHMASHVDDSKPLVFDDLDEGPVEKTAYDQQPVEVPDPQFAAGLLCSHCKKPNPTALCSDCFIAGHRNGHCLVCTEKTENGE